jgi:nucleoside-diphosphate-sugar epimerase
MIRFIERGLFVLPGGGTARRTLSAAPLVAEALAGLAEREPRDGVFNVADPASPTLRRLADDLAGLLGARRPRAMPAAACLLPAAFFSALQAAGVRNRLHLANLRRLTGSNPVDCGALRELLGPPKDHYAEALAADVRWHRATR